MNHLPSSSLLHSRAARIELARQRFFDEGQAPTGIVTDTVFESWSRCLRLHGSPHASTAFEPVTPSRANLALAKNRELRQAWVDELPRLESILGQTSCAAMLTDATGVLIGASCVGRAHEELMPVATRTGVDLSEDAVGTTAPGVAARTGKAVVVLGGEHFFDSVKDMHCAAAPIRDIRGCLAGVLDISSERIPFRFDAAAVVGLYAGAIENRLLLAQSRDHLVIRIQLAPELLDSAMVGLIGIDASGQFAWENAIARSLLGRGATGGVMGGPAPEECLGLVPAQLAALPPGGAVPLALPNGLVVWARGEMRARDGLRGLVAAHALDRAMAPAEAPPEPAPHAKLPMRVDRLAETDTAVGTPLEPARSDATDIAETPQLRESSLALIQQTLAACNGNVSEAATRLGVSRGLIYRRLRGAGVAKGQSGA